MLPTCKLQKWLVVSLVMLTLSMVSCSQTANDSNSQNPFAEKSNPQNPLLGKWNRVQYGGECPVLKVEIPRKSVEFFKDGKAIISLGDEIDVVDYSVLDGSRFSSDGELFEYAISDNTLVMGAINAKCMDIYSRVDSP
ncbi:hypothetical protein JOY44_11600 [Phormidium sp. CLA17]|uniref:hypothetical protein n=1 Tax=Leptolyngbya sp. Cla-17 TaxID=2803751 RepID=UPI0014913E00|nr:hypothetical protein [Leptolyngbya sp. Cla-17]MBM0742256.1 hypothetical protein [Leptolyngbya sp. Cla-17]